MNIKFEKIDSIIYYDESKELFNYPFSIEFQNTKIEIDFLFKKDDYESQDEMIKSRKISIANELYDEYFLKQFEALQLICLEHSQNNNDELMSEINERLDILYYLFILIIQLDDEKSMEDIWGIYDELIEMFNLLEDLYAGIRKKEILDRRSKFIHLEDK